MDAVDLDTLSKRESEQIEWKEGVADINDVVATLSAFANDLSNLGGGYVVCGAAERKDENGSPTLERTGITLSRIREFEGQVLTRCRDRVYPAITPLVQEIETQDPGKEFWFLFSLLQVWPIPFARKTKRSTMYALIERQGKRAMVCCEACWFAKAPLNPGIADLATGRPLPI